MPFNTHSNINLQCSNDIGKQHTIIHNQYYLKSKRRSLKAFSKHISCTKNPPELHIKMDFSTLVKDFSVQAF